MVVKRGAKPKSAHLRLVTGTRNVTRHGSEEGLRKVADAGKNFAALEKPKHFRGEAAAAWKRYIEPAYWLDGSKEPAAIAFCELWQEFRAAPLKFPASKHSAMRAYMGELGLTDERNRPIDTLPSGSKDDGEDDDGFA